MGAASPIGKHRFQTGEWIFGRLIGYGAQAVSKPLRDVISDYVGIVYYRGTEPTWSVIEITSEPLWWNARPDGEWLRELLNSELWDALLSFPEGAHPMVRKPIEM